MKSSIDQIFTQLFKYKYYNLFPINYHFKLNLLMLIVSSYLLFVSVLYKKYVHDQNSLPKIHITMFNIYLMINSVFYIFDLLFTGIVTYYFNMALHHLTALMIFYCFFMNSKTVNFYSILPFWFHGVSPDPGGH